MALLSTRGKEWANSLGVRCQVSGVRCQVSGEAHLLQLDALVWSLMVGAPLSLMEHRGGEEGGGG